MLYNSQINAYICVYYNVQFRDYINSIVECT